MPEDKLKWFKTAFPVHGIGWQLVGPIIALVVLAAVAAVWPPLRDPAEDFLNTDAEVWHVLLTTVVGVLATAAFTVWWSRRRMRAPEGVAKVSHYPREIDHFGVKWPIDWPYGEGVLVGKPACPVDRTTMGYVIHIPVGDGDDIDDVHVLPDYWKKLQRDQMYFHCFKDGSRYDLRGHGYPMAEVIKIVEGQAWGNRRTAFLEAEAKKRK